MKVTVLGIGNAFSTSTNSTAFLIKQENGNFDLVDCGWGILSQLIYLQKTDFDFKKLKRIFITHTHEDHIANLSSLLYYFKYRLDIPFPKLYVNDSFKVERYLSLTGHGLIPLYRLDERLPIYVDNVLYNKDHINNASIAFVDDRSCYIFTGDTQCTKALYDFIEEKIKKNNQKKIVIFHDCQIYGVEPPEILKTPHATYKHILISYPQEWIEKYIIGVHFGTLPKESIDERFEGIKLAYPLVTY